MSMTALISDSALILHDPQAGIGADRGADVALIYFAGDGLWLRRAGEYSIRRLRLRGKAEHGGAGDHHVLRRLRHQLESRKACGCRVDRALQPRHHCDCGDRRPVLLRCVRHAAIGRDALRCAAFVHRRCVCVLDPALAQSGAEGKHRLPARSRKRLQRPVRVHALRRASGGDAGWHHTGRGEPFAHQTAGVRACFRFWHRISRALGARKSAV